MIRALARSISLDTIRAAAPRVYTVAVRTPLVRLEPASDALPEIWLKLESLQPIGAFKIRGAANAIAQLSPEEIIPRQLDGVRVDVQEMGTFTA